MSQNLLTVPSVLESDTVLFVIRRFSLSLRCGGRPAWSVDARTTLMCGWWWLEEEEWCVKRLSRIRRVFGSSGNNKVLCFVHAY